MPTLDPLIIQEMGEISVRLRRASVPTHEVVEAFAVRKFSSCPNHSFCSLAPGNEYKIVFVSIFGVGGAIVWTIR
jgi:hypothetical protein